MKRLLFILTMLLPTLASAYDAQIDGIYYNLYPETKTAEVTYYTSGSANWSHYSGEITIPNEIIYNDETYTVNSIHSDAFRNCTNLTKVSIPNSVIYIGGQAFLDTGWYNNQKDGVLYLDNCILGYKGDKPYGNVNIEEGTRVIAERAFSGCYNMSSIYIPNSLKSIGDYAFVGDGSLTSIKLPEGLTHIGQLAFSGCYGLTSVTIPSSVTSIESSTFENCSSIKTITIPNSVTFIGSSAFYGCSSLTSIMLPEGLKGIDNRTFQGCSSLTSVSIPSSVTSLGNSVFQGCKVLNSIIIPDGVTIIGEYAFQNCSGLATVSIPNSVKEIGKGAFDNCTSLTTVNIPDGVTSIAEATFHQCGSLASVSIPNSVTTIGNYAFWYCWALSSIYIPNSVTTIGKAAFGACSALASISIPNSVTTIDESAFMGCSKASVLKLPNNLQIIKKETFKDCSSLKSIVLPASIEYIYQSAFDGCIGLESVAALPETPPFAYDNSFPNYEVTLKVPENSIEKYRGTAPWSNFGTIQTLTGEVIEGPKCATPAIALVDGKLKFTCETEEVDFHYTITNTDKNMGIGNNVVFTRNYRISVYASKDGYQNSEVATKEIKLGEAEPLKGDVNGDGAVDIADAVKIVNFVVGKIGAL